MANKSPFDIWLATVREQQRAGNHRPELAVFESWYLHRHHGRANPDSVICNAIRTEKGANSCLAARVRKWTEARVVSVIKPTETAMALTRSLRYIFSQVVHAYENVALKP